MSRTRELTVVESEMSRDDVSANVIGRGFSVLVKHNEQLAESVAAKDALLMQFVSDAQKERSEFWKIQSTPVGKFTEMIDTLQKLKDREADREEKRKDNEAKRQLHQTIYSDVRELGHVAVNQFTKRPLLKESEKGILSAFVESFDEGQIQSLQASGTITLRAAQMAAFGKMIDSLKAIEDKEQPNAGSETA